MRLVCKVALISLFSVAPVVCAQSIPAGAWANCINNNGGPAFSSVSKCDEIVPVGSSEESASAYADISAGSMRVKHRVEWNGDEMPLGPLWPQTTFTDTITILGDLSSDVNVQLKLSIEGSMVGGSVFDLQGFSLINITNFSGPEVIGSGSVLWLYRQLTGLFAFPTSKGSDTGVSAAITIPAQTHESLSAEIMVTLEVNDTRPQFDIFIAQKAEVRFLDGVPVEFGSAEVNFHTFKVELILPPGYDYRSASGAFLRPGYTTIMRRPWFYEVLRQNAAKP